MKRKVNFVSDFGNHFISSTIKMLGWNEIIGADRERRYILTKNSINQLQVSFDETKVQKFKMNNTQKL